MYNVIDRTYLSIPVIYLIAYSYAGIYIMNTWYVGVYLWYRNKFDAYKQSRYVYFYKYKLWIYDIPTRISIWLYDV